VVSEILASSVSGQRSVPHVSVFSNKAFMPDYIPKSDVSIVAALMKRVDTVLYNTLRAVCVSRARCAN
jgi:hypothetical protein